MGFLEATGAAFLKALDFKGRSTRSEYWWFMLASITIIPLIYFVLSFLLATFGGPLLILIAVPAIWHWIASISLTIRRLRDAGGSVWWFIGYVASYIGLCMAMVSPLATATQAKINDVRMSEEQFGAMVMEHSNLLAMSCFGFTTMATSIVVFIYMFVPSREPT